MFKNKELGLILAIVFASSAISGSLVFFGMQYTDKGGSGGEVSVEKIEQAFETFAKKQMKEQKDSQLQVNQQEDQQKQDSAKNVRPVDKNKDHIRGNVDALVTLIEYSDFECPFCKKVQPTLKQLLEANGDKVNIVYRHLPLGFHDPLATLEAEATECVADMGGNDKFWAFHDMIFDKTASGGNGLTREDLVGFVDTMGLDKSQFNTCLDTNKFKDRVLADADNAGESGITGTPGNILINNKTGAIQVVDGAQSLAAFQKAVDDLLK